MFEPWQMREMRPCPRQIREICSCARAAAGLEGAAGAGRGPAQNTLQTTQSQWLRPASIAGQSVHERARSAPRKNWGICAFPRNFRPVGANARNLAARANPRNLGAVSPPYYPLRDHIILHCPHWVFCLVRLVFFSKSISRTLNPFPSPEIAGYVRCARTRFAPNRSRVTPMLNYSVEKSVFRCLRPVNWA